MKSILSMYFLSIAITVCECINNTQDQIITQTSKNYDNQKTNQTEEVGYVFKNFTQLAESYGLQSKRHVVQTEDGYRLSIFQVFNKTERNLTFCPVPLFLMHGILNSGDGFIIRAYTSLVAKLAEKGCEVWVGNCRGNTYGREHVSLDPDVDKEFWRFSFNEIGIYDMPATIDHILNTTKSSNLQVITHSDGSTAFFVMSIKKPEYNAKVKSAITLAPVCLLNNVRGPALLLSEAEPIIRTTLDAVGLVEVFSNRSSENILKNILCTSSSLATEVCANLLQALSGFDETQFEPAFWYKAQGNFPAGASVQNILHILQGHNNVNIFTEYNYGISKNVLTYSSVNPPSYNLSQMKLPVSLLVAKNDFLSTVQDVELFMGYIPDGVVQNYLVMPRAEMSHYDFIWGKDMEEYLYPYLFAIIESLNK